MAQPKKKNRKSLTSSFVLSADKLRRLAEIVSESFQEATLPFDVHYSVTLLDDRQIETDTIEEVLSLDNTVKNPIKELQVEFAQCNPTGSDVVQARCTVVYDSDESTNLRNR